VSAPLVFTAADWSVPQSFTVTGVAEGSVSVTHAVTSSDGTYNSITVGSVGVNVVPPVLVSNVGQTTTSNDSLSGALYSQGFTTGANADGYSLESVGMAFAVSGGSLSAAERDTVSAELWSDSSGAPGSKLHDLTVPAAISAGTVLFAAPANTVLEASTTYHLVVYSTGDLADLQARATGSDSEDAGAASGWSIANSENWQNQNTPGATWRNRGLARRIVVNGVAIPPPDPTTLTLTTSAQSNTVAEDGGTVTITATLNEKATSEVSVSLAAGAASTAEASDYLLPGAFTIAVGQALRPAQCRSLMMMSMRTARPSS